MGITLEGPLSEWRRIRMYEKVSKRQAKLRAYPRRTRRARKAHGRQ